MMLYPEKTTFRKELISSPSLPYGLLLVIVGAVYGSSLFHGFVWDDHIYLLNKPVYQQFDLQRIFLSLANDLEYLPVRDISYALDWAIWGRNPFGFHLTNILLFAATVLLFYRLASRLMMFLLPDMPAATSRTAAFIAAALFAVHPIHLEVVCFVTGRNALLAGLFSLLSCDLFLRSLSGSQHKRLLYAGSLIALVLALFSKATSLPLPLLLALPALFVDQQKRRRILLMIVPFLVLAGASFVLFRGVAMQSFLLPGTTAGFSSGVIATKAAVALQIPVFYLGKLLLPLQLYPEYTVAFDESLFSMPLLLALGLLLVLGTAAFTLRHRQPLLLYGAGWFLLALLPALHIFPTYPVVADRYVYLPSFGFCLAVGTIFTMRPSPPRYLIVAAIAVCHLLAVLSLRQSNVWRSDETLWRYTIKTSPTSVKAYTNLGRVYFKEGRYPEAFALFDQARRIAAGDPHYDFYQGFLYFIRNDYPTAQAWFRQALARDPQFLEAQFHLALTAEALGNRAEALTWFRASAASKQDDFGGFKLEARRRLQLLESK